jgi:hypothetical protein
MGYVNFPVGNFVQAGRVTERTLRPSLGRLRGSGWRVMIPDAPSAPGSKDLVYTPTMSVADSLSFAASPRQKDGKSAHPGARH